MLLGLDVFMHFCDKESFRLFSNLGLLFVVSALCAPTYYLNSDLSDDNSAALNNSDAFPWIATGYVVLFWVTLAYTVLSNDNHTNGVTDVNNTPEHQGRILGTALSNRTYGLQRVAMHHAVRLMKFIVV